MGWLAKRVWQLGIAVVLILLGTWLSYMAGTAPVSPVLLWGGLGLVFAGMAIPLLSKAYQSAQEVRGEEGES